MWKTVFFSLLFVPVLFYTFSATRFLSRSFPTIPIPGTVSHRMHHHHNHHPSFFIFHPKRSCAGPGDVGARVRVRAAETTAHDRKKVYRSVKVQTFCVPGPFDLLQSQSREWEFTRRTYSRRTSGIRRTRGRVRTNKDKYQD